MHLPRSLLIAVAMITALTVGLLIGASMAVDEQLLARQEAWITALEHRFDRIQEQQHDLRLALEETQVRANGHRQLAEEMLLAFAAIQVGERQLVIWPADGEAVAAAESLAAYLHEAGARVVRVADDVASLQRQARLTHEVRRWQQDDEAIFVLVAADTHEHGDARPGAGDAGLPVPVVMTAERPVHMVTGDALGQRWSLLMGLAAEDDPR